MKILLFLIMTVFLSACSKTNIEPPSHHLAVNFSADISQSQVTPITRATATNFVAADAIGVFMKTAGSALSTSNLANNVQYTTNNGSNFTATAPIYYPQIGNVDFIAYYPYTASLLTANTYRVNVAIQSTPSAIDLLWSNNATAKNKSNSSIALQFKHQLSSIVLNVKAGVGLTAADLAGMAVTITSMPLYADFNLGTGALSNIGGTISTLTPKAISTASGYVASLEAIVVPQSAGTFAGRTMNFTLNGSLYRYPIAASVAFDASKKYIYNITIDRTAINVTTTITDWTGTGSTTNMGAST